ncbi:MAG: hypothetical protein ACI4WS_02785 [Oscillospiraceae bacterium]
MKVKAFVKAVSMLAAGFVAVSTISACSGSSTSSSSAAASSGAESETASNGVLRVVMECTYAPFNWTQVSSEVKNGDTAVEIYGGGGYAYGYDVMVAKKLADELGVSYLLIDIVYKKMTPKRRLSKPKVFPTSTR